MWTDPVVERAKQLHAEHLSRSQIAAVINKEFSTSFSRNAVIGKLNRLGFRTGPRPRGPARVRSSRPRGRPPQVRNTNSVSRVLLERVEIPVPIAPSLEHKISFAGLDNPHCRYPLWTEDTPANEKFYCGTPQADLIDGRPYCPFHQSRTRSKRGEAAI